jgi:chromosome partitioning protein
MSFTTFTGHLLPSQEDDYVGINEIAEFAKTSRQAVANWRARFKDFPKPVADLKAGPVFRLTQVRAWLRKRKVPMAHVISIINLKGGVAKTTTAVALAETLSSVYGKRVLVVDLDPQTNATTMLIGETRWKMLNEQGFTLATLFKDALQPNNKHFNLEKTLQKRVSDVQGAERVDLLPSSLDLIDVQDRLATAPMGQFYSLTPTDLLRLSIKSKLDEYDFVLIDCPPNLGIITLNGLRISEGYIIPTVPDVLSTYGIPQILKRVASFASEIAEPIEPLGIIVTKYQVNSTIHINGARELRRDPELPYVFDTMIKQANQIAAAAEYTPGQRRTLKQKYGYGTDLAERYIDLAKEIIGVVEPL